jgi:two-component system NarL family sensor kinase
MELGPVSPVFPVESSKDSCLPPRPIPSLETNRHALFPPQQPDFTGFFQQLINGLPEQIALLDEQWVILATNPAWLSTAALYNYDDLKPGTNYLDFCTDRAEQGHVPAAMVVTGIQGMCRSGQRSFHFTYHGKERWEGHAFQLHINRFELAGRQYATATRYDVTELVHLRELRAEFSHSLIEGQAEERRRMAREVHDSTMQLLVGMGFSLGQLKRSRRSKTVDLILDEMGQLLAEAQSELRTISYLAHAPLVTELGLSRALRELAGGFGRRTGLNIAMNLDDELVLAPATEVAIYRIVQEALSNVHRHAQATEATVSVLQRRSFLHVVVADNGVGMPAKVKRGVGLSSMHDRIQELGGRLLVSPAEPGTVLIASVPASAEIRAVGDLATAS